MTHPDLTFFCELEAPELTALFARPEVLPSLQKLGAGVSLGLLDLSSERAEVVRALQQANIPITAWLLLPRDQGYFQHVGNARESAARFEALCEWSHREGLAWRAVGLDIEQDRRELERYLRAPWRAVPTTLRRAFDKERLRRGLDGYRALVGAIRSAGWQVETYQFPALADDRRVGSTLLQRAFGMMDLAVDREVWMLYSSILPPRGPAWLCSYGREAKAIALGSTGGGIDPWPKLTWEALRRDLLLARQWTDTLYLFSLEGCVTQGFLPRLVELDWESAAAVAVPPSGRVVDLMRRAVSVVLWTSARLERK